MTDFSASLAAKLGQSDDATRLGQPTRASGKPRQRKPAPVQGDNISIKEWSSKPRRAEVLVSRGVTQSGWNYEWRTPAAGFFVDGLLSLQNPETGEWQRELKVRRSRVGQPPKPQQPKE